MNQHEAKYDDLSEKLNETKFILAYLDTLVTLERFKHTSTPPNHNW